MKYLFLTLFGFINLFSQNIEFQSFKSQFPKNNKDLSITSLDSLSVYFFEIMEGFFDEKIQNETKYKQIIGSGLNFYKKCEKYLLERDKDIRYSENEVPEAIINYTFDKIELFIVKVNFREEIGGVSKIGVFTNQKGDILNVISLESAGFDIGSGNWYKYILDKNNLYLMKLDLSNIGSQFSYEEAEKLGLFSSALLSGKIIQIRIDSLFSTKSIFPIFQGEFIDKSSGETLHLIYSQPYSNVKPTFHVLYQANKNSKLIPLKVNFKDKISKIIEVEFYTSPNKYTLTIDQKYLYCKTEGEKMQSFERIKK